MHALREGQLEDAILLLNQLKSQDPISMETRCCELEYYLKSNKLKDAAQAATQLVVLFPDSSRILCLAGQVLYRQKHYSKARDYFRECFYSHPSPYVQRWLGRSLIQLGEFDEAKKHLDRVIEKYPRAHRDFAWLHERGGDLRSAIKSHEKFLEHFPTDSYAKKQIVRLKAEMLEPQALFKEVESLTELGEKIPPQLLPTYILRLLELGQGARARELIAEKNFPISEIRHTAWICYKAQAYDLAFDLFRSILPEHLGEFKLVNAFEAAAKKCQRLKEVIEDYEKWAPSYKPLYGKIRALKRMMEGGKDP